MLDHPGPEPLRSARLDAARQSGIRHGFFTRKGGVSAGIYAGLNVGMGSGESNGNYSTGSRNSWFGWNAGLNVTSGGQNRRTGGR